MISDSSSSDDDEIVFYLQNTSLNAATLDEPGCSSKDGEEIAVNLSLPNSKEKPFKRCSPVKPRLLLPPPVVLSPIIERAQTETELSEGAEKEVIDYSPQDRLIDIVEVKQEVKEQVISDELSDEVSDEESGEEYQDLTDQLIEALHDLHDALCEEFASSSDSESIHLSGRQNPMYLNLVQTQTKVTRKRKSRTDYNEPKPKKMVEVLEATSTVKEKTPGSEDEQ